jgi:hypothetical protein
MTTHHNIHLVKSKTDIKVTYRDGKFRKLEHLRGKLDQVMLNIIGRAVPQQEKDLPAFVEGWKDKVIYTTQEKKNSHTLQSI